MAKFRPKEPVMIKEVLRSMHTVAYAEIALLLFVLVFVSVLMRVLLLRKDEAKSLAMIPLEDAKRIGCAHMDRS